MDISNASQQPRDTTKTTTWADGQGRAHEVVHELTHEVQQPESGSSSSHKATHLEKIHHQISDFSRMSKEVMVKSQRVNVQQGWAGITLTWQMDLEQWSVGPGAEMSRATQTVCESYNGTFFLNLADFITNRSDLERVTQAQQNSVHGFVHDGHDSFRAIGSGGVQHSDQTAVLRSDFRAPVSRSTGLPLHYSTQDNYSPVKQHHIGPTDQATSHHAPREKYSNRPKHNDRASRPIFIDSDSEHDDGNASDPGYWPAWRSPKGKRVAEKSASRSKIRDSSPGLFVSDDEAPALRAKGKGKGRMKDKV
ncbi:hypothetical protein LTR37_008987 [Vermiconidia calcicola]|uniref:Uncharacterized protein n=1 Tax=Vermiconidia calcicola TaxID=1690605 RepID=A0ACC3NAF7_9PEZI|nr:hypothetical protein LTR37_008987 [Vermiconidia calcicola]